MILTMSVLPFVLGLYALKILEQRRRDDDDLPPPPGDDPLPPTDPWPVSPSGRRRLGDQEPAPSPVDRRPVASPVAFRSSRVTTGTREETDRFGPASSKRHMCCKVNDPSTDPVQVEGRVSA